MDSEARCYSLQNLRATGGNCGSIPEGREVSINGVVQICDFTNFKTIPQAYYDGYCVAITAGARLGWGGINLW